MKNIFYILLLLPTIIFAQYPSNSGQKITLGEQTTADGLVFRGVANDTNVITPFSDTSAYIILDTVNSKFYHYNRTTTYWALAGGGVSVSSFSAGTTGLTPSTATTGAVTLGGTLAVANGGTGQTTSTLALNALLPTQSQSTTIGATIKSNGTNSYWDNFKDAGVVQDQSGNFYNTVTIGTQVWFKENLRTKKYRSGALIPVKTNTDTSTLVGQMYYYANDSLTNYSIYGTWYNWMATQSSDSLCPVGYHVPTDTEWTTLYTFLGGSSVAGGKLKLTTLKYWLSPNTGATNESGFTGLPAGFRDPSGVFSNITNYALFWTSSISGSNGIAKDLNVGSAASNNNIINKSYAASVRCLRNTPANNLSSDFTGILPVANGGTGITSLGSGVATFLGTPSSANLASAVTNETGSGALVFGTSPTIQTATITGGNGDQLNITNGGENFTQINFGKNSSYKSFLAIDHRSGFQGFVFGNQISETDYRKILFRTNGSVDDMIITNSEVWIGYTTDQGAYPLQVNGQIFATNATIATSDEKFKENITPLNKGLEIVNKLKPVTFNFIPDTKNNFSEYEEVGFIAQDVDRALSTETFAKSIVKAADDSEPTSTMGLATQNLIPILVKAIQEQNALIKSLEQRILILENK